MMRFTELLTAGSLVAVLAACGNPAAVVTYHQTGACNGFKASDGSLFSVGDNAAYVIFGIESIANPSGSGATFNFDPTRVFTTTSVKDSVDPGLALYPNILGPFAAVAEAVTEGNTINFAVSAQMGLVVQTTNQNGSVEANQTPYLLSYNRASSDPGVIMVKSDSSQTSWPNTEDCSTISLK
jgi:hypothetical protein